MNINENKKTLLINKILLSLSVVLFLFSSFNMFQNIHEGRLYYEKGALGGFLTGLTLIGYACLNIKRIKAESEGKTIGDERSRRTVEKAGFFAFFLLLGSLTVSGLANSAFNLKLEYTSTVNVILVACVFLWIIVYYYLDKKGEV
ncbi:MAG: DUF2178 domain-containing protein [Candidatus Methanoperedens sp.]|nr:DUF2178 domain-containing protein [Candidatus Methanoperedens sp.]